MNNPGKKSFLIYHDNWELFESMSNDEAGQLFKALMRYSSNSEIIELPPQLKYVFVLIKKQMDRDLEKYNSICERNQLNGLKGGRPRNPENPVGYLGTQNNPEKPKGTQNNPEKPKKPDIDIDIDKDTDISNTEENTFRASPEPSNKEDIFTPFQRKLANLAKEEL